MITDIQEFDNIPVSTRTFTATTNMQFDIAKLYEIIPITPYVIAPKKEGRKKKSRTSSSCSKG